MRIQSKFKDYYDFASPYYDDGKNTVVFERKTEQDCISIDGFLSRDFNTQTHWRRKYFDFPEFQNIYSGIKITTVCCAVADELVLFYKIENDYANKNGSTYYSTKPYTKHFVVDRFSDDPKTTKPEILKTSDYKKVVELQEKYKTPIILFSIAEHKYLDIVINPCLMEYHINNVLYDQRQTYQNIEMWLTNFYNKTPVSNITDPEKIVSHGFDKKTSFRHPIK